MSAPPPRARQLLEVVLLAVVYAVVARAALSLDAVSGFATLVWPPTGLCIALLTMRGLWLWPGVLLGAAVANAWVGAPLPAALGVATGNMLEAVVAALVLRRMPGFLPSLERLVDVAALTLVALAAPLLSASLGVAALSLSGKIEAGGEAKTWLAWWIGDVLSALVLAPVLLSAVGKPPPAPRARAALEALLLAALIGALGAVVFVRSDAGPGLWEKSYLLFPPLVWAAIRYGARGAAFATLFLSAVAIWGTALG